MQIRIRESGAVMYEQEFRAYQQANGGPTWAATTEEVLEALGADVVFEGPQAQPTRYQVAFANGSIKNNLTDIEGVAKVQKNALQSANLSSITENNLSN